MKLTKPQYDELKKLAKEPQSTYGAARTRVQNTLVKLKLAEFEEFAIGDRCRITDSGRVELEALSMRAVNKGIRRRRQEPKRVPPPAIADMRRLGKLDSTTTTEVLDEVERLRSDLTRLTEMVEAIVPYVVPTIEPRGGCVFRIERLIGVHDPTNTKDWIAVHAGRAHSSCRQLEALRAKAKEVADRLKEHAPKEGEIQGMGIFDDARMPSPR